MRLGLTNKEVSARRNVEEYFYILGRGYFLELEEMTRTLRIEAVLFVYVVD